MKRALFTIFIIALLATACGPAPNIGAITPPYIDTGIDPDSWALIPAGEFPYGQHEYITMVDYDYEIMVTPVTNEQFASYLNEALASGTIRLGEVEVEAGDEIWIEEGVSGFYPGDPFDGYKHEEEIKPGDKLHMPLNENGLRLTFAGESFEVI